METMYNIRFPKLTCEEAEVRGHVARLEEQPAAVNPYHKESELYALWLEGWNETDNILSEEEEE
jgi:hypothetical protein